ncbi:hypothetical protein ACFLUA_01005 [Chloroflexota bacterium]
MKFNLLDVAHHERLRFPVLTFSLDAGLRTCTLGSTRLIPGNIYPIVSFTGFLACADRLYCRTINTYLPI